MMKAASDPEPTFGPRGMVTAFDPKQTLTLRAALNFRVWTLRASASFWRKRNFGPECKTIFACEPS